MINVTKTFLPPFEDYLITVKRAWDNTWITNNGELLQELENKLKDYLGLSNLLFCSNGTVVLQMALKALDVSGEVITTPFSYVATTTAILWENCRPVFADINEHNFCIDASKIEALITPETSAILATHVYGHPCDIAAIEKIAVKHRLRVIYDGAHAFGTKYNGRSVFNYGDISTCSFHATKLFHTGEGGCVITNNDELLNKLLLYRQFGHIGDDHYSMGINGKNSELHAAMGLCNLKYIDNILEQRKKQWLRYADFFRYTHYKILQISEGVEYNYAYFPLVFRSEEELLETLALLKTKGIFPRRYFYPSLNALPYIDHQDCPVAESVSGRVICLPLFFDLRESEQQQIAAIILQKETQHIS